MRANTTNNPYHGSSVFAGESPDSPDESDPYHYQTLDPTQWNAAQAAYQGAALDAYNRMASGASSVGQAQQAAGLGQVTGQMLGRSVGRGGNPLAMRNALVAGAQGQQQAMQQAAQQRAQEAYAAQKGYAGALSSGAQGEIEWQKMKAAQEEAAARQWAQMAGVQASQNAASAQQTQRYMGAAASAAGAGLGSGS
jgi:hypothetical protein